jgi:hypothetical protein
MQKEDHILFLQKKGVMSIPMATENWANGSMAREREAPPNRYLKVRNAKTTQLFWGVTVSSN